MQAEIARWLREIGVPNHGAIESMTPGLGKTTLWRISAADGDGDLVLRMFPRDDTMFADREALAMRTAQEQGVPVPSVMATGVITQRPVMLTSFARGETVATVMRREPEQATAIGQQLGSALASLHHIVAPVGLAPPDRWIERGGPALAPLHGQLRALPMADRLLHLDYHPENVMMYEGTVSAIIDWTNTLPGPPHMDLARSRSILVAAQMSGAIPVERQDALTGYVEGLVEGHLDAFGPDTYPALSAAWSMAMTVDDLTGHLGKAGSWVTEAVLDRLRVERDDLIASAAER